MYSLGDEVLESCSAERNLRVLVDSKLKMNHQHVRAARKTNRILGCVEHGFAIWSKELIVLFYTVLVQPHLGCCVHHSTKKGMKLSECLKEGNKDGEWSRGDEWQVAKVSSFVFFLEKRNLRGDLMAAYSFLM